MPSLSSNIMYIYLWPGGCITSCISIYSLPGQYPVVNTDKERIITDAQNTVIFIVNFWLSKYKIYLLHSSQSNFIQLTPTMEKAMSTRSSTLALKIPWTEEPGRLQSMGSQRVKTRLSKFTFPFHFHALEKEMATHSSVLAWRIPGTAEPGGLLSMWSHRVRHD